MAKPRGVHNLECEGGRGLWAALGGSVAVSKAQLLSVAAMTALVAFLTAVGWHLSITGHTPFINLLRDANMVGHLPWYNSGLEYAGFVMMSISVGAIALAAVIVEGEARKFLIKAGIITAVLIIDDVFMMHEQSWRVGLTEKRVFALYGLYVTAMFLMHWRYVLRTPVLILGAALGCFAISIILDLTDGTIRSPIGSEDVAELLGFALWATYWAFVAHDAIVEKLSGAAYAAQR